MTVDEAKADPEEEQFQARIDAIVEGDRAIMAIARGEAVDPVALDRAAAAMAEILADSRITGSTWTMEDVEMRCRLRAMLLSGASTSETHAAAAACRLIFFEAGGRSR
jgi:O-acetylhomoserine/O-acetylserine sulfhydrylase-like pyridoxal-dependent enzyme